VALALSKSRLVPRAMVRFESLIMKKLKALEPQMNTDEHR
jgi:hypothetical protein